jgi:hypothetical protein
MMYSTGLIRDGAGRMAPLTEEAELLLVVFLFLQASNNCGLAAFAITLLKSAKAPLVLKLKSPATVPSLENPLVSAAATDESMATPAQL